MYIRNYKYVADIGEKSQICGFKENRAKDRQDIRKKQVTDCTIMNGQVKSLIKVEWLKEETEMGQYFCGSGLEK